MKKITISFLAALSIIVYACNSRGNHEQGNNQPATEEPSDDEPVKQVKASFANVDAGVASHIKKLTGEYLALKDALTNDKAADAAGASKNLVETVKGFDKSLLTAEQKKIYDSNEGNLKQHAGDIAANTDLKQQRDHFAMLSDNMYELVKAFGAGQTIYSEYCPMAKNDTGAIWLSESKTIRNPYFGSKMIECGSVKEAINN